MLACAITFFAQAQTSSAGIATDRANTNKEGVVKTANSNADPVCDPITAFPWTDGFETFDPSTTCWTLNSVSSVDWELNTDADYIHQGTKSIFHNDVFGAQDSYLISPQLALSASEIYTLTFWSYNRYPGTYGKNSVLISTSSNSPSAFVEIWSPENVSASWVETTIDLSAYSGSNIYIAFRYEGDYKHRWYLDDVSVATTGASDMCNIQIEMHDTESDGWHGSKIEIHNGSTLVGSATLADDANGTATIPCPIANLTFTWVSNSSWDKECYFEILDADGVELYAKPNNGAAPPAGEFFAYNNTCLPVEYATVSGTVSALAGGAAIANASITFEGPSGGTLTSNASGNYTIQLIQGQSYDITVAATGYNTYTEAAYTPSGATVSKNFAMRAPQISVSPNAVSKITSYGTDATATVTISNTGNGPLNWHFTPQYNDGGKAENTISYALMDQNPYKFPLNDLNSATQIGTGAFDGFVGVGDYFNEKWYAATTADATSGNIYSINPDNGAITLECQSSVGTVNGMAGYAGDMYVIIGATMSIYILDLETGAGTLVTTVSGIPNNLITGMAIDNNGRCFVLELEDDKIYEIDLSTGVATTLLTAPFDANFGQDLAMDREKNQLYWAAFNHGTFKSELYKVNTDDGTLTLIGDSGLQTAAFAIPTVAGWLSANPTKGTIAAGGTQTVTLTMDGSWATEGVFYADAIFKSRTPNVGEAIVDVTFIIGDGLYPMSKTPENGATEVATNAPVSVSFSGNITAGDLSGVTISPNPGGVSASISGAVLTIAHNNFADNTNYTVIIPEAATSEYNEAIFWSFTTGVKGISNPEIRNVKVYPNPASSTVNIEGENIASITVYNNLGQHIAQYGNVNTVDVSSYSTGIYFFNILTSEGRVERTKVIVAR